MTKLKMTRHGEALRSLPAGHRRRLSDGRNAWRKMSAAQRREFIRWICTETDTSKRRASDKHLPAGWAGVDTETIGYGDFETHTVTAEIRED